MRCERCLKDESGLAFLFADAEEMEGKEKFSEHSALRVFCSAMHLCPKCVKDLAEEVKAFRDRFILQINGQVKRPRKNSLDRETSPMPQEGKKEPPSGAAAVFPNLG